MGEFDKLLREYDKFSDQIREQRDFLEYLEGQRIAIRKRLRLLAEGAPSSSDGPSLPFAFSDGATNGAVENSMEQQPADTLATADAVAKAGDIVSAKELAAFMGISQDAARLRLQRAARAGQIMRVAFGKYRAKPSKVADPSTTPERIDEEGQGQETEEKKTTQTASP